MLKKVKLELFFFFFFLTRFDEEWEVLGNEL